MQALNRTIKTLIRQLGGFSATAKMLIASLMVILVMGLVFVALYAGRPDMIALGLTEDAARIKAVQYLDSRSIPYEDTGGDVLVPVDHQILVLAYLTENDLIGADQIDFKSIMMDDSPFTDRLTKNRRYLVAKMNEVARMISQWSVIERATVRIDQPERSPGIGAAHIKPTAAVSVTTSGGPLSQSLADSIARTVAGAHASLDLAEVTVVDARTGRSVSARTAEDLDAGRHLELKQAHETRVSRKIADHLDYIPGVRVAVNAQVDGSEAVMHKIGVEEPKLGVEREISNERSAVNQSVSAQPGVASNTGANLSQGPGRTSTVTDNENDIKTRPVFPYNEQDVRLDQGFAVRIDASVLVPRSFFVQLYRQEQGDEEAQPDSTALATIVQTQSDIIRQQIMPLIGTDAAEGASAGTVVVDMFADFAAAGLGGLGSGGSAASSGGLAGGIMSEGIIKTVGLGAMAIVSLLLMLMMVRRASRDEEMPTAEELVGIPPALAEAESDLVGEASESTPAMEGLEIEEDDLRRQQMLGQVNELAVNSPQEAAGVVRKWIKNDE